MSGKSALGMDSLLCITNLSSAWTPGTLLIGFLDDQAPQIYFRKQPSSPRKKFKTKQMKLMVKQHYRAGCR